MRVWLQWAKAVPEDWFAVDIRNTKAVRDLPKRPEPTALDVVDGNPGWLCGLNCQGIDFSGYDHTAVEFLPGDRLRITGWQDDPVDHGDTRWATEWTLSPPAPDPALGGRVNTVQVRRVWGTPDVAAWFPDGSLLPWAEFVPPATNLTIHGIWMPDALYAAHRAVRTPHGWREWAQ